MANLRADNLTGTGGRNAIDGSLFFNHGYLTMASGEIISGTGFGTNDFTIEFWINQGVNASNYTILLSLFSSTNTDRFEVAFHSSTIQVYTATGSWADTGYAPISGQWEHIAFQRDYSGNTLKMYANGEEKWSVSNNHDYNEVYTTTIGSYDSTSYGNYQGYLSNFRICTHLVYASNYFTPPTQKLGLHPETILLCCQDSNNPLQEATGKTITGHGNLSAPNINLVPNGDFTNGQTSWTVGGSNNQSVTGTTMRVSNDSSTNGRSTGAAFETVDGAVYRIKYNAVNSSSATFRLEIRESGGGGSEQAFQATSAGPKEYYFTATESQHSVVIYAIGSGTSWAEYANIRVEAVTTYANAPKVLPPVGIDEGVVVDGYTKINSPGVMYFPTGDTAQRGRGRGLFAGGYAPSPNSLRNIIDYVQIQSQGNAIDFGDLLAINNGESGACSSSTRALYGGGQSNLVDITYVTIATTSNATDFGDLLTGRRSLTAVSNSTRGLFAGGTTPTMKNEIEYVTIASIGNATDFGDLTVGRRNMAPNSSPTRGVFAGGNPGSGPLLDDTIDYVTIASAGNATDFGNMTQAMREIAGSSSSTRGLIAGGYVSPANINNIEYITIATTGNATDFGDLHTAVSGLSGTSNGTRGVFAGGSYINNIQYVTIATTGNASDFGDLTAPRMLYDGTSDSHGGLS